MNKFLVFSLMTLTSATAFAQAVAPETPEAIVGALASAFSGGQWHLFASAVILALVWLVTKAPVLSNLIKGKGKVWLAAITGILSAVAVTAFTTNGDWFAAIANGAAVGFSATGLFELLNRKASNKPIDADNDGILDPK
jgi:hypothetical protein